jgi:hypothetical protein
MIRCHRQSSLSSRACGPRNLMKILASGKVKPMTLSHLISARLALPPGFFDPVRFLCCPSSSPSRANAGPLELVPGTRARKDDEPPGANNDRDRDQVLEDYEYHAESSPGGKSASGRRTARIPSPRSSTTAKKRAIFLWPTRAGRADPMPSQSPGRLQQIGTRMKATQTDEALGSFGFYRVTSATSLPMECPAAKTKSSIHRCFLQSVCE